MALVSLFPSNDWVHKLKLFDVPTGSVSRAPLTTGVVTGFFSISDSPTATAADPSLVITCAHVSSGWWRVSCDASLLTPALLATLFTATPPFAIFVQANGIRTVVPCEYAPVREATVA